ncbi:MAG: hypothetical protein V2B19_29900 [Pseudomonadota bacterium]
MPWVYDPHSGGITIPERSKAGIKSRILAYANEHYAGKFTKLDIRFRKKFCYISAFKEPYVPEDFKPFDASESREECIERQRNTPIELCRLRHFTADRWSVAFFSYGNMKYEPCVFNNGTFEGTPEEGFEVGAMYLAG